MKTRNRLGGDTFTKVTRKGQVTIPEKIRNEYRISRGDLMLVGRVDGTVILRKLTLPSWDELFGYGEEFAKAKGLSRQEILEAVKEIRRGR